MSFWKKSSRSGKDKGKGKESSSQIPNTDEANEQWMHSLLAMGSPPGQLPYGGPSPLQTPPARRLSPYFNSAGRMPFPADDVYRPQFDTPGSTPGDQESQAATLSAEDFEVEETPTEPPSRSGRGKAPASSAATDTGPDERPKRVRTTYTLQESELIADCWADTSQDAERSNYQTEIIFWERIAAKYRSHKTASMKDHGSEAIRRHWERLMRDCGHFNGIYSNLMTHMTSGQNEHMVRDEAIRMYSSQYLSTKGFKYWNIYDKLKDLPKFRTGMHDALHGKSVRSRLSVSESEGSAAHIDLSGDGPHERPEGVKKAKGRRKGKGATSEVASESVIDLEKATYSSNVANLTQMYTLYFTGGGTPEEKAALWKCIQHLQSTLGLDPDAPPAPPS